MRIHSLTFVLAPFVLASCEATIVKNSHELISTQHHVEKSYTVSDEIEVGKGDVVLSVKEMDREERLVDVLSPTEDFVMKGGPFKIEGSAEDEYVIEGTTVRDDIEFQIVRIASSGGVLGVLVDREGKIYRSILKGRWKIVFDFDVTPETVRLLPETGERTFDVVSSHFELLYDGIVGESARFRYREYDAEGDVVREKNEVITHPLDQEVFRFRGINIRVIEATEDSVKLVVTND